MNGLPPTDLFTGTWEVFYTDVLKTYEKMKAAGVKVRLHVAEKMGHTALTVYFFVQVWVS